jgi:hypothetical protein
MMEPKVDETGGSTGGNEDSPHPALSDNRFSMSADGRVATGSTRPTNKQKHHLTNLFMGGAYSHWHDCWFWRLPMLHY